MTHWKKLTNPDYLGAYAIETDDIIATIKVVKNELVTGPDGKKEECTVAYFEENGIKPMILNATNCKTISKLYKTPYIEEWAGRKIAIYKEEVRAFGELVEALRIRSTVPKVKVKSKTYVCADCGCVVEPFGNATATQIAQRAQDRFGKVLCAECGKKAAEDKLAAETEATDAMAALDAIEEGKA